MLLGPSFLTLLPPALIPLADYSVIPTSYKEKNVNSPESLSPSRIPHHAGINMVVWTKLQDTPHSHRKALTPKVTIFREVRGFKKVIQVKQSPPVRP